ncbi:MAG TPA: 50S ribosomal protein L3 N(5)-glutamine methyltransferase [Burkholderiales bacterium]|nr:50S ribosomal protein L3 N(5)-glutamine methyltransferase [Burkholderiales bacterium]
MVATSEPQRTVAIALEIAASRFEKARLVFGHGTHNAYDEAAWLMLHVLKAPIDTLQPLLQRLLTASEQSAFDALVERRINERKPAAYLLQEAWLGQYRFYVDERVIVPRSFIAELLQERLQPWVDQPGKRMEVLDLCTGSGCLAICAALNFPRAVLTAADLSREALEVAKRNVRDYELESRITLFESDLFRQLPPQQYDIILSNPPYVDAASMSRLPREYRHEPRMSLASGKDGLDAVRVILRSARAFLKERGLLIVEIGHNRSQLERTFPHLPFTWLEVSAGEQFVFLLTREQLL